MAQLDLNDALDRYLLSLIDGHTNISSTVSSNTSTGLTDTHTRDGKQTERRHLIDFQPFI